MYINLQHLVKKNNTKSGLSVVKQITKSGLTNCFFYDFLMQNRWNIKENTKNVENKT